MFGIHQNEAKQAANLIHLELVIEKKNPFTAIQDYDHSVFEGSRLWEIQAVF